MDQPGPFVSMYVRRRAGSVSKAQPDWGGSPPMQKAGKRSAAQAAGIRYENKVLKHLSQELPLFIDHLPFIFISDGVRERCIPDGICLADNKPLLTIVEVKLRHSADAWFQLNNLYLPVVRRAFPQFDIKLLEVCKFYDPAVRLPCGVELIDNLRLWLNRPPSTVLGVYTWGGVGE